MRHLKRQHTVFSIFQRSPIKQLQEHHELLLAHAFRAQRNGDIRQYSMLTAEAKTVSKHIRAMKDQQAH